MSTFYYTGFTPFAPPLPNRSGGDGDGGAAPKKPAAPPAPKKEDRMCLFVAPGGRQVTSLLPPTLKAVIDTASSAFDIPLKTFSVRLSVSTKDAPAWFTRFATPGDGGVGDHLFIGDDPSYQFYVAGRPAVIFQVWVFDKADDGSAKGFPIELICETKQGKALRLQASIEAMGKDLKKDAPFGSESSATRPATRGSTADYPALKQPTSAPSPSNPMSFRFQARLVRARICTRKVVECARIARRA